MKKLSPILITILCASILLTGCTGFQTVSTKLTNTTQSPAGKNAGDKSILLSEYEEDLYADSSKEKLALYVQETNDMPTAWSLNIDGKESVKLDSEEGLYGQASIEFKDINGDQKPEVFFYRYNTGSAGAQGLNIYQVSDTKLEGLFSNPSDNMQDRYEMKYLGDYKVSFADHKTGLAETILLDKVNYQNGGEDLLKGISTWVDPISQYEILDNDSDGSKKIVAVQRVIGVSHADTIGTLKTTYAMSSGQYKPFELALYDSKDTLLKKVEL